MSPSFFDLPSELRLHVYEYFLPPVMEVNNAEDLLSAQRLRATCRRARKELDELHRRIKLAIKASTGGQEHSIVVSNKGSKPKIKFNIPVSLMKEQYQFDWDPRTTLSYSLMGSTPLYVQACFFQLAHDIKVTPSEAAKYAGQNIGGRIFYVLDNPEFPKRRSVRMLT